MKKFLSIALALLMVCVMLPVVAMADESVTTAEALQAAVVSGGEVTLGTNIQASIKIPAGRTVTLKLNGYTLTNEANKDTIYVELGGTLVIEGSGKVDNISHACAAIFNNGTTTLNGGTFDRSKEASTDGSSAAGNSYYTILNHGQMTINDGVTVTLANGDEAKGRFSSLIDNGYYSYTATNERSGYVNGTNQAEPSLTINGGNFSGGKITIKNDDGATLVINDGTFTNAWNRVVYNANVATINGGSFSCPTNNEIAVDSDGLNNTVNKGILTISGGTFEGKVIKSSGSIAVSGGTYTKGIDASYLVEGKTINSNGTVVDKTITIIVPSDTTPTETPKTEDQKNPSTGANDFVGLAAAAAVVALLGSAVVLRKK
ncbi:MAG: hypothetical protein U0M59_09465 [Angelakisella sp.]